jgi:hypothetical protein
MTSTMQLNPLFMLMLEIVGQQVLTLFQALILHCEPIMKSFFVDLAHAAIFSIVAFTPFFVYIYLM